jgi:hypothetical protein
MLAAQRGGARWDTDAPVLIGLMVRMYGLKGKASKAVPWLKART